MIGRLLFVLVMLPALLPAAVVVALVVCGRFVLHGRPRVAQLYRTSATPAPELGMLGLAVDARRYADLVREHARSRRAAQN